jgi:hypothetical protein
MSEVSETQILDVGRNDDRPRPRQSSLCVVHIGLH